MTGHGVFGSADAGSSSPTEGVEVMALARDFKDFAEQAFTRLPLYRRIAEGVAGDLDVVRRLLLASPAQRVPNLLLAAVHDVLLEGLDDLLADWYPSVAAQREGATLIGRTVGHGADDPWPHFRRLALGHEGVADRLRTRRVQTNEVGRSAILMPALFHAGRIAPGAPAGGIRPLGIVEVGASAGLNLRLDRYGYRYERLIDRPSVHEYEVVESIGNNATLILTAKLRGPLVPPLPDGSLSVDSAIGIDEAPLAVAAPADARWLMACQWPEHLDRMKTLRDAIARAEMDPPTVIPGDAVRDVAAQVRAVAPHAYPVVVSTWMLTYLDADAQRALLAELDLVAAHRDLSFIFAEQPARLVGIDVPPRPDGHADGLATALVQLRWSDGQRTATRLADAHPHGRWIEWLDS